MTHAAKKITLRAKKQVYSGMLGNHSTLFKGQGFDFMELREYQNGDDVKHIDWIVTAKKHKPYVKIFHEQRQINVGLLALFGGSMYFGTAGVKQEVAAETFAALAYAAVHDNNRYSLALLSDRIIFQHKPARGMWRVQRDTADLLEFEPRGREVDYSLLPSLFFKRSLLFVIGDFVGDIDLSHLARKHEVVAIVIRDRFEQNPQPLGQISGLDPATHSQEMINFDQSFAKGYKKAMLQNDERFHTHCRRWGIRVLNIYTDESPYQKLLLL